MNNLTLRAISGTVYVGVIIAATIAGGLWFSLLMAVFAALASIEFTRLTDADTASGRAAAIITCTTVVATTMTVLAAGQWPVLVPFIAIAFFLLRGIAALYDRRKQSFAAVGRSMLCYLYIGLPLSLLGMLAALSDYFGCRTTVILMIFAMIWLNDTGAYLVGSRIGRRRLFERLSPKKSWEGFFGGLIFCVLAGAAAALWTHTPVGTWQWLALGIIVCAFATWGDLFESLLKRTLGVKDSGNIIPGHGGILDRIDSLLFVAPAATLFLFLSVYYHIL